MFGVTTVIVWVELRAAEPHEVSPAQASEVEAALGRITLRLVREAEAEAGRTPAVTAAAGAANGTSGEQT